MNSKQRQKSGYRGEDKPLYSGVGRCQKVCACVCWGRGGGHTDTYIYVPSVKNQYKRDAIGYMVNYVTAICVSLLKFSTR